MSKEKEIEIADPESEQTANEEQPQPEVQEAEEDIEMAEEAAEADPVAKLEAENAELKDQLLRKIAEFDNYRKRTLKEKTELILKKFVKTLESIGVKKIDTEDKDFDVDFHEAIAMVPGMGDEKKGKVIDCVQTGYTLNDKVIRHAKVAVGQ